MLIQSERGFLYFAVGIFLLLPVSIFGQTTSIPNTSGASPWNLSIEKAHRVFIENKGQFNSRSGIPGNKSGETILYAVNLNGVDMYFTSSGISFRHDEFPKLS